LTGVNEGNKDVAARKAAFILISTDVVNANASSSPPQSPGSGETPAAFGFDWRRIEVDAPYVSVFALGWNAARIVTAGLSSYLPA